MTIILASSWSSPVDSPHGDLQYGLTVTLRFEHHSRQDFLNIACQEHTNNITI